MQQVVTVRNCGPLDANLTWKMLSVDAKTDHVPLATLTIAVDEDGKARVSIVANEVRQGAQAQAHNGPGSTRGKVVVRLWSPIHLLSGCWILATSMQHQVLSTESDNGGGVT
jgi:hypothetical protein